MIKIFIDKIPMGGRRMFHNLNKEKHNNIDEFISAFYHHQLQLLNEISVEITKLSSVI